MQRALSAGGRCSDWHSNLPVQDEKPGKRGVTRLHLMQVAENLFSERGLHRATLKEINAAGQRNESALHYQFAPKPRLVDAILSHSAELIDRHRVKTLTATWHTVRVTNSIERSRVWSKSLDQAVAGVLH